MSRQKLHKWDVVFIIWQDITGQGPAWEVDIDDDLLPAVCVTSGIVLQYNKQFVKICGSANAETISDKVTIPRGTILKVLVEGRASAELRSIIRKKCEYPKER